MCWQLSQTPSPADSSKWHEAAWLLHLQGWHSTGAGPQRETVLLRFSAGPPYEDVAFRIINKAWDTGRQSGFRCTFERGVLHLFFMFQRARYRR